MEDKRMIVLISERGTGKDYYFKQRLKKDLGINTTLFLGNFKTYRECYSFFKDLVDIIKEDIRTGDDEWEGR